MINNLESGACSGGLDRGGGKVENVQRKYLLNLALYI